MLRLARRCSVRWRHACLQRHLSATGTGSADGSAAVFSRAAKVRQRLRALTDERYGQASLLKLEVARRVADRLLDIKRQFEVAAVIGNDGGALASLLPRDRVGTIYKTHTALPLALARPAPLIEEAAREAVRASPSDDGESLEELLKSSDEENISAIGTEGRSYSVVCDEEWLPFAPNSLDLVLACSSLHWINDLPGFLAQASNALRPDGCFIGALVGGDTLFELRSSLQLAEQVTIIYAGLPQYCLFIDASSCVILAGTHRRLWCASISSCAHRRHGRPLD